MEILLKITFLSSTVFNFYNLVLKIGYIFYTIFFIEKNKITENLQLRFKRVTM